RYIDRNYAGVLVIWDRLFGSYVEEDPREAPVYGIVEPLHTYNPLKATFHEWASMAADFVSVRGWRNKLRALFAPPAWAAAYHAGRAAGAGAAVAASCGATSIEDKHTAAFQTPRRP
ncbi:MAG: sterol desaturase family protein, partial [Paraburkholderia nemoris]